VSIVDEAIARTLPAFWAAEFPAGRPALPTPPVLAAVGTLGARALASSMLRDCLDQARVAPADYRPYAEPAALLAAPVWALALVLSPYKRAMPALCARLAPAAAATGVADTLLRADGETIGVNTNVYAAAAALRQLVGEVAPRRALIAGTGASARSVALALTRTFPTTAVGVIGRAPDRAARVVATLPLGTVVTQPAAFAADLVINTTTIGETDDAIPPAYDLAAAFAPGVRYFDLNNRTSALQTTALAAGSAVLAGAFMQRVTNALRVALLGTDANGQPA
jgi:shikimate dehydrogenase